MTSLSVNLNGFAALQARLEQLSKVEATKAGQAASRAGMVAVRKRVIADAPSSDVPEGEMRNRTTKGGAKRTEPHHKIKNAVKIKKTKSLSTTEVQTTVFIDTYHASFVEFGSIHNAPDPFFRTAFEAAIQDALDAVAKTLNKQLIKRSV